ncbi:MAG: alkaline phosphatase [Acidimicrobiia bacterium]|nr:alkaline phosphatase [Acidimicrobiia bacterium]
MKRRNFLRTLAASPALLHARSTVPYGVQTGDVIPGRAIIWSRAESPSRMIVDWSQHQDMRNSRRMQGLDALPSTGLTARLDLRDLPLNAQIHYQVRFLDLRDNRTLSEPVNGTFRTAPTRPSNIRFLWSGDTAGQGYGINPDFGGMRIYETMRRLNPDFFLHSGDTIYADNPIPAEIRLPSGDIWRNITTEVKSKVAETLDEFRGNYLYNLMDEHVRRFNSEVPQIWQWDDHEVTNNWSPGKDLATDQRYAEKNIAALVTRARQAFLEHAPIRLNSNRLYRRIPYGPLLDIFVIDMRSYRAANSYNLQPAESPETLFLGRPQLQWLRQGLKNSRALWKVIASDMPIGLIVGDGGDSRNRPRFENCANSNGPALGRELEIASLLKSLKQDRVRNTVWLTADVHYTAAHFYDPAKAQFTEFDPFWEFISGPLHAGTFGPGTLDNTFGPQVIFQKAPPKGQSNLPPSAGLQFFGEVTIDGKSGALEVILRDLAGDALFRKSLDPAP